MSFTRFDIPAQQQTLPSYTPEPVQAYAAALASMQGRYDKAYIAAKTTQNAISAVPVRSVDAGSKQAYVDLYSSKLREILNNHNGNYADAANEIDNLSSFITSDGHLAGMSAAHTHAQKVQEDIEKDPSQIAFNLDALYKPYLNADGTAAGNLTAHVEKREDWLGAMDKVFSKVKDSEMADIRAWAKDPAFYENIHTSGVSEQRIQSVVDRNIGNYIHNTKEGNQHWRAAAQDILRSDLGVNYLGNATKAQRDYADRKAKLQVTRDFLDYGDAYTHNGINLGLTHNPEYATRVKEAKESEYAGFVTSDTIPVNPLSDNSGGTATGDALGDLREKQTVDPGSRTIMVGGGSVPGVGAHPVTVNVSPRDYVADKNPKVGNYLRAMAQEYGTEIWGGKHASVALGILNKQGGKFGDLPDNLRKDLADYVENHGNKRSPYGSWKSLQVQTISPDAVKLPGKEPGQMSFNQTVFGQNSNDASEIPDNLPLFAQDGTRITGRDYKAQQKLIDDKGLRKDDALKIQANVSGLVTYNTGRRLATTLDQASPYFWEVSLGGQKFYTPAPNAQVLHNNKKDDAVFSYGQLQGHDKAMFEAGQHFDRAGQVSINRQPIPNVPGMRASYKVTSTGSQPEYGIDNSKVTITLHDEKSGRNVPFELPSVPNFFDHIDKSRPDYGLPAEIVQSLPASVLQQLPSNMLVSDVVTYALARQLDAANKAKK